MQKIQGIFANLADVGGLVSLAVSRLEKLSFTTVTRTFENIKLTIVNAIKTVTTAGTEIGEFKLAHYLALTDVWSPKIVKMFGDIGAIVNTLNEIMRVPLPGAEAIDSKMKTIQSSITGAINAIVQHGEAGINFAIIQGPKIKEMINNFKDVPLTINSFIMESGKYTDAIVTTSITKTQTTITQMVGAVQKMDDALSKLGTINIGTRLDSVAKSLGIGSSGTYTVESKQVVININFAIQMDAGKVEKAMLMNTESIIKDRINFALGGGGGKDAKVSESLMPNMSYLPVSTSTK